MKKTFQGLVPAICLLLSVTIGGAAKAQEKFALKFGWVTSDSADDPYAIGAHAFKEIVEAKSGGRIEVTLFPNRQLGDELRLLEGVRFGTVDGGVIINSVVAQLEPSYQVHELPFVYATSADARRVLDGPVGAKMATKLADKGVMLIGSIEGGYRVMLNNKRPLKTPADMHDIKFRVMQNPLFVDMFTRFGGNPIPLPIGETFIAVQQGTVGGIDIATPFIEPNKWNEVFRYVSNTNHTYSAAHLVVSKRLFDRMPKDLQAILLESGRAAAQRQRELYASLIEKTNDILKAKGMQINEVSDVAAWRDTVKPIYDKFRDVVGKEILEEVLAGSK
jgi:tripartite ATP-independent transporter DctP family solute receptor